MGIRMLTRSSIDNPCRGEKGEGEENDAGPLDNGYRITQRGFDGCRPEE